MPELDIIEIIEENEEKRIEEKPSTKPKKKKDKKKAMKKKKSKELSQDKLKGLPEKVERQKIRCKEKFNAKSEMMSMDDIKATSKTIYVHDIHDANPQFLEVMYWVVLKDHRFVSAMISEKDYERLVKEKPSINHHITVVDCGVFPTLSYPFKRDQLKNGEFPTLEEIEERDHEFKNNPTNFHNPSLIVELLQQEEPSSESLDDEDEFIL